MQAHNEHMRNATEAMLRAYAKARPYHTYFDADGYRRAYASHAELREYRDASRAYNVAAFYAYLSR